MSSTVARDLYLGASIAISWAWGTSLVMGMQIAQTKGALVFLVWAAANCLTLGVFGLLFRRGIVTPGIVENKPVKYSMLAIQCLCLLIQMKVLHDVLLPLAGDAFAAYCITAGVGVFFVVAMYARGLSMSILTDNWQAVLTLSVLLAMLFICSMRGAERLPLPSADSSGLAWAGYSACVLLSGIITDMQHWQRAKVNGNGHAFEWATVLFAVYLALVFALAQYELPPVCQALLCVAVLGVTTSTVDSVAVACHSMVNRTVGTTVCLFICVFWGLFADMGLIEVWSRFGAFRIALALVILSMGVYAFLKRETE